MINLKDELDEVLLRIKKKNKDINDLHIRYFYGLKSCKVYNHYNEIPLDNIYDDGYGSQYVFGYVVFKDGSWLERYEYDGAEEWDYKSLKVVIDCINEFRRKIK